MRRRLLLFLAALLVVAGSPVALPTDSGSSAEAAGKTWGDHPLDDVLAAANANRACGLSRNQLAAMMMAPAWPETGAPDHLAPSPMTLSRWDDQSRLWAFSGRQFPRAFWHPGVGLWQFDSAGLGAPYTASQRIDTRVIANIMAATIANRWCSTRNLAQTWAPWFGCDSGRCGAIYLQIYNPANDSLRNLTRATTVGSLGGMESRTCRGPGISGSFTCWRVDPSRAQGYNGFAQPSYSPRTPITAPFYVYTAGGREYRHWLQADTGYDRGIWATRPLGQNARSSLSWNSGESLCDVGSGAGACCPALTVGYSCLPTRVNGTYRAASGDFNGDGVSDVLWYGPGDAPDVLWFGTIFGVFQAAKVRVGSDYQPVVGDFDGDGRSDILWYGAGAARDYLWYGRSNNSFVGQRINVPGNWRPAVGDFDGDGHFDIFWYGPGDDPDFIWYGLNRRFTGWSREVGGDFEPFAGDFDGDGRWDVFWYAPGEAQDVIWYGFRRGAFSGQKQTINGDYEPVAGRLNRGRRYDILWYRPGEGADVVYLARHGRTFEARAVTIDEEYEPFVGDFTGDGPDDVFFYGPGADPETITRGG